MPEMTGIELLEQAADARARRQARAAHRVRRHRRGDQGDQRHRPRLLPAQAVGPARRSGSTPSSTTCSATGSEAHPSDTGDVRVVGHRWSERSHEIKTFLARNHVPYRWLDVDRDDEAQRLQELAARGRSTTSRSCWCPTARSLRSPSTLDLADALGLRTRAEQPLYDLCIVGGGPAGLAAAVYGASEGLRTVVVEREAPGGQAGQSACDRELPRVPEGPVRRRPHPPRGRPGARGSAPRWCWPATSSAFETRGPVRAVRFGDGAEIEARAVARRDRRLVPPARGARARAS